MRCQLLPKIVRLLLSAYLMLAAAPLKLWGAPGLVFTVLLLAFCPALMHLADDLLLVLVSCVAPPVQRDRGQE